MTRYGLLGASELWRLRELEAENARLKGWVADSEGPPAIPSS